MATKLLCWGSNNLLQCGAPSSGHAPSISSIDAMVYSDDGVQGTSQCPPTVILKSGSSHSMGLFLYEKGKSKLLVWGNAQYGQLPFTLSESGIKLRRTKKLSNRLDHLTFIAGGGRHSLFCCLSGRVLACGSNIYGQLGTEKTCSSPELPVTIPLEPAIKIKQVECGANHSLLLTQNGVVLSFGRNHKGQLGLGHVSDISKPTAINLLSHSAILEVSSGEDHSFALTADKRLFQWGNGIACGSDTDILNPSLAPLIDEEFIENYCVMATGGSRHSLILTDAGHVFSWGSNDSGQLGLFGRTDESSLSRIVRSPTRLNRLAAFVTNISAAVDVSAAVTDAGNVFLWGKHPCCTSPFDEHLGTRTESAIGTGHLWPLPSLVRFAERQHVVQIACGAWHCVAVTGPLPDCRLADREELVYEQAVDQSPAAVDVPMDVCVEIMSSTIQKPPAVNATTRNNSKSLADFYAPTPDSLSRLQSPAEPAQLATRPTTAVNPGDLSKLMEDDSDSEVNDTSRPKSRSVTLVLPKVNVISTENIAVLAADDQQTTAPPNSPRISSSVAIARVDHENKSPIPKTGSFDTERSSSATKKSTRTSTATHRPPKANNGTTEVAPNVRRSSPTPPAEYRVLRSKTIQWEAPVIVADHSRRSISATAEKSGHPPKCQSPPQGRLSRPLPAEPACLRRLNSVTTSAMTRCALADPKLVPVDEASAIPSPPVVGKFSQSWPDHGQLRVPKRLSSPLKSTDDSGRRLQMQQQSDQPSNSDHLDDPFFMRHFAKSLTKTLPLDVPEPRRQRKPRHFVGTSANTRRRAVPNAYETATTRLVGQLSPPTQRRFRRSVQSPVKRTSDMERPTIIHDATFLQRQFERLADERALLTTLQRNGPLVYSSRARPLSPTQTKPVDFSSFSSAKSKLLKFEL